MICLLWGTFQDRRKTIHDLPHLIKDTVEADLIRCHDETVGSRAKIPAEVGMIKKTGFRT